MFSAYIRKIIAVFLVAALVFSDTAGAAPFVSPEVIVPEMHFYLPAEFGRIEHRDISTQPGAPVLFHILDAHGNVSAQKNIQRILEHLNQRKPLTLLLEGGFAEIKPELLSVLPDTGQDREAAQVLLTQGAYDGPGMFLLENMHAGTPAIPAYGVEDPALYIRNLELYRSIKLHRQTIQHEFISLEESLLTTASRILNPELLKFFKYWLEAQRENSDLVKFLPELQRRAKEDLAIDLENPRTQVDWPQMVRLLQIRKLEGRVDEAAALAEFSRLEEDFESMRGRDEFRPGAPEEEAAGISLREEAERFFDTAQAQGFTFENYPAWSMWLGFRLLSQELDAVLLFEEINALHEQIFENLAQTDEEKIFLQQYRIFQRLKKTISLEQTRNDYKRIAEKEPSVQPAEWTKRMQKLDSDFPAMADGLQPYFEQALKFYEAAQTRDETMFRNIRRLISAERPSVFVSGGFHGEGIRELCRREGFTYISILPHIQELGSSEAYEKTMLLESDALVHRSGVDIPQAGDTAMPRYLPEYWQQLSNMQRLARETVLRTKVASRSEQRMMLGMQLDLQPQMSLAAALKPEQKVKMEALMDIQLLLQGSHGEIPDAAHGIEALKEADRILRERNAIGVVAGSVVKSLWSSSAETDIDQHKDIDVLVLSPDFSLEQPFEGGIDWFLPEERRLEVISGRGLSSINKTVRYWVNGNGVFVRAGIVPDARVHQMTRGLWIADVDFYKHLTEAAALNYFNPETTGIDDEVLAAFRQELDGVLSETLHPVWKKVTGVNNPRLFAYNVLELDPQFDFDTVRALQVFLTDSGRRQYESLLEILTLETDKTSGEIASEIKKAADTVRAELRSEEAQDSKPEEITPRKLPPYIEGGSRKTTRREWIVRGLFWGGLAGVAGTLRYFQIQYENERDAQREAERKAREEEKNRQAEEALEKALRWVFEAAETNRFSYLNDDNDGRARRDKRIAEDVERRLALRKTHPEMFRFILTQALAGALETHIDKLGIYAERHRLKAAADFIDPDGNLFYLLGKLGFPDSYEDVLETMDRLNRDYFIHAGAVIRVEPRRYDNRTWQFNARVLFANRGYGDPSVMEIRYRNPASGEEKTFYYFFGQVRDDGKSGSSGFHQGSSGIGVVDANTYFFFEIPISGAQANGTYDEYTRNGYGAENQKNLDPKVLPLLAGAYKTAIENKRGGKYRRSVGYNEITHASNVAFDFFGRDKNINEELSSNLGQLAGPEGQGFALIQMARWAQNVYLGRAYNAEGARALDALYEAALNRTSHEEQVDSIVNALKADGILSEAETDAALRDLKDKTAPLALTRRKADGTYEAAVSDINENARRLGLMLHVLAALPENEIRDLAREAYEKEFGHSPVAAAINFDRQPGLLDPLLRTVLLSDLKVYLEQLRGEENFERLYFEPEHHYGGSITLSSEASVLIKELVNAAAESEFGIKTDGFFDDIEHVKTREQAVKFVEAMIRHLESIRSEHRAEILAGLLNQNYRQENLTFVNAAEESVNGRLLFVGRSDGLLLAFLEDRIFGHPLNDARAVYRGHELIWHKSGIPSDRVFAEWAAAGAGEAELRSSDGETFRLVYRNLGTAGQIQQPAHGIRLYRGETEAAHLIGRLSEAERRMLVRLPAAQEEDAGQPAQSLFIDGAEREKYENIDRLLFYSLVKISRALSLNAVAVSNHAGMRNARDFGASLDVSTDTHLYYLDARWPGFRPESTNIENNAPVISLRSEQRIRHTSFTPDINIAVPDLGIDTAEEGAVRAENEQWLVHQALLNGGELPAMETKGRTVILAGTLRGVQELAETIALLIEAADIPLTSIEAGRDVLTAKPIIEGYGASSEPLVWLTGVLERYVAPGNYEIEWQFNDAGQLLLKRSEQRRVETVSEIRAMLGELIPKYFRLITNGDGKVHVVPRVSDDENGDFTSILETTIETADAESGYASEEEAYEDIRADLNRMLDKFESWFGGRVNGEIVQSFNENNEGFMIMLATIYPMQEHILGVVDETFDFDLFDQEELRELLVEDPGFMGEMFADMPLSSLEDLELLYGTYFQIPEGAVHDGQEDLRFFLDELFSSLPEVVQDISENFDFQAWRDHIRADLSMESVRRSVLWLSGGAADEESIKKRVRSLKLHWKMRPHIVLAAMTSLSQLPLDQIDPENFRTIRSSGKFPQELYAVVVYLRMLVEDKVLDLSTALPAEMINRPEWFAEFAQRYEETGIPRSEQRLTQDRDYNAQLSFYEHHTDLHDYQPVDLMETMEWLMKTRYFLNDHSLSFLMAVLLVKKDVPAGEKKLFWRRSAGAYQFYLRTGILQEYQPVDLQSTLDWLVEHKAELGGNSLRYLIEMFILTGKLPDGQNAQEWRRAASALDFYYRQPKLQEYQTQDLKNTLLWLEAVRGELAVDEEDEAESVENEDLRGLPNLVKGLGLAGKLPADADTQTWIRTAGARDFYLRNPLLQQYRPETVEEAVRWLSENRDELEGFSLSYGMQALAIGGNLPENASESNWWRTAAAYEFYLGSKLLQSYRPKNLKATLDWLKDHRAELGGNSLSYLMQAFAIAGVLPKGVSEVAWIRRAGSYDFYLNSPLLQSYEPDDVRETLDWLHANRAELNNNALGTLIAALGVAGRLPEPPTERYWTIKAGAYDRAVNADDRAIIESEIRRIWSTGAGAGNYRSDTGRLQGEFNADLLLSKVDGEVLSKDYRNEIMRVAYDLYGKSIIEGFAGPKEGIEYPGDAAFDALLEKHLARTVPVSQEIGSTSSTISRWINERKQNDPVFAEFVEGLVARRKDEPVQRKAPAVDPGKAKLRTLIRKYGGVYKLIADALDATPGGVKGWIKKHGLEEAAARAKEEKKQKKNEERSEQRTSDNFLTDDALFEIKQLTDRLKELPSENGTLLYNTLSQGQRYDPFIHGALPSYNLFWKDALDVKTEYFIIDKDNQIKITISRQKPGELSEVVGRLTLNHFNRAYDSIRRLLWEKRTRSEQRSNQDDYFDLLGRSEEAVLQTARIAENIIGDEHRVDESVFRSLIDKLVPVLAEEAQIDLDTFRGEVEERIASLERLLVNNTLRFEGDGTVILTTAGNFEHRRNLLLGAVPFFVALSGKNGNEIFMTGENADALKKAVFARDNGLTAEEKNSVSRILKFAVNPAEDAAAILEKQIRENRSAAASLTAGESQALGTAFRSILKAIEEPADRSAENLSLLDQSEAYAARTLLLLDLARHLQLRAETLKDQPEVVARLVGDYLRERLPDVSVNVFADGSFSLSLSSVAAQLAVFRAASESFAKSA